MRLNHGFFRYEGCLIITLPLSPPLALAEFLFLIKEIRIFFTSHSRVGALFDLSKDSNVYKNCSRAR